MSDEHDELKHYGILRKSGRYPWGSGENPYQRSKLFTHYVDDLRKQGLSDVEIAKGFGVTTTELRQNRTIANNAIRAAEAAEALRLKEKGYSNVAIGERMGKNESSVRSLLNPSLAAKRDVLETTAEMLRDEVASKKYLDVGKGSNNHLDISPEKLNTAIAILRDEGYQVMYVKVPQLGTKHETTVKVLVPEGVTYSEVAKNYDKIGTIAKYSTDKGRSYNKLEPPVSVSSDRIQVRYAEDGGAEKDGVIELRRGVDDISLGGSRYAQVRIAVDDTHYLKGMAVYSDDMPKGVDIIFNTNKGKSVKKQDTFKVMVDDPDNPFGSTYSQRKYVDKDGKEKLSALNIVNEEGDWYKWSKTLSSQMLSKQPASLAKKQLDLTYDVMREEYNEIKSLTNPTIKRRLLEAFADEADSASVHLKAAGLPRTRNHVILPVPSMKETEIYAPQYRDGERVVLIRHPHGGIFEIPELTVNNRQPTAKKMIGQAIDAVAINSKVAEQLSGADFDGDTVLVIPTDGRTVKTSAPLKGLKNFDPQVSYPGYPGMKKMKNTQTEMGMISNLITDMSIRGAPTSDIVRAVRHSMVVIDAEKHGLNYKQSAIDNGIKELKKTYQGSASGGASTLISKASSKIRVPEIKPRSVVDGGPIDPKTGEKKYTPTGRSYVDSRTGKTVMVTTETTPMAATKDAHTLSSGTVIEKVYADHANKLKALANQARLDMINTPPLKYSPSAKQAYATEVEQLRSKLNVAQMNAPLERQAQLIGNSIVDAKRRENPDMDADTLKKVRNQALDTARARTGAGKQMIEITPKEWEAIQAGAISNNLLSDILSNTNLQTVKEYATPRTSTGLSDAKLARAKAMMAAGYSQSDVADALGISTSTLHNALNDK